MKYAEDTIVAISTPYGSGGIGVIRLSGKYAFDIAAKIFQGKKEFSDIKSHTINYGKIVDVFTKEVLDEVLLSKMKAPNTFTRENIVEINTHGSQVVLKNILELTTKLGARVAEPGEFTKRAFLSGRIDLSQAEAVIDVINSKTDRSLKAALNQLEGALSKKLLAIRSELIKLIAHIEVTIDYPEYDIDEVTDGEMEDVLFVSIKGIDDILKTYDRGRILREGISMVIVGKPNVGKSSLLNSLSGKNKAIVTNIPGTTRDVIEEYIDFAGVAVRLVDTAGIRDTMDIVEKIGVEKSKEEAQGADLIVFLVDASRGMDKEDEDILELIKDKNVVVLMNKIDLVSDTSGLKEKIQESANVDVIEVSVLNEVGLSKFESYIRDKFLKIDSSNEVLLTNIRHKNLLEKASESLNNAVNAKKNGMPLDMITIDIRQAANDIGEVTGEEVNELILQEIFSKFCVGK
ncbi:MAG: tRNA uridine-5-carboxymethylaminomethyl(34) synthesis GTPase MnmE [Clostridiales bacterium]|nr:tRNA uridine-5-carboxymethylaminomethyl(34) synthesis GTPase MnmE [Clostridiales bacterium]